MAETMLSNLNHAEEDRPAVEAPSRARRILRNVGWGAFALFCLVSFTILKLPEDRVRNYVQGTLSSQLADRGIGLSVSEGRMSIGFGISYVMKDVILTPPPPAEPAKLERVVIAPAILPLLTGRLGGQVRIDQGKGHLKASFSMKKKDISISLDTKDFDLGKAGILPLLAEVRASAVLSGGGDLKGEPENPSTLSGDLRFDLRNIVVDSQAISGFSIPKLAVSEGALELTLGQGKALIKSLRLGKRGNAAEDISGNVSGDVTLGRNWPSSSLNLKTEFGLSQNVLKTLSLLDMLLGPGKRPDGTYAYNITGPATAPMPVPAGPAPSQ